MANENRNKRRLDSKQVQEKIKSIAEAYVNDYYICFQYPENRGKAFTWKKFPKLIAKVAETHSFMYFQNWDSFSDELKESVKNQVFTLSVEFAERKLKDDSKI